MANILSKCPSCGSPLQISVLSCAGCGLELKNDFELSPFDRLEPNQKEFLLAFLAQRGNMSGLQEALHISYPTAKKRLDALLEALQIVPTSPIQEEEEIDMSTWNIPADSVKASDLIKKKLMEHGGRVIVHTVRGLPCEFRAAPDGQSFTCDKLPIKPPYRYEVFDIIVDLLKAQGGRAKKGNGRNYRLGQPECDETTVVGAIGYHYFHGETGKSVFDPVFALAAMLDWAGIAHNERGALRLTANWPS